MESWSVEKKWLMIHQDHQAELLASGTKQSKLTNAAVERASIDVSRLPQTASKSNSPNGPFSPSPSKSQLGPAPAKSTSSPIKYVHTNTNMHNTITATTTITTNNALNIIPVTNKTPTSPKLMRSQSIANLSPTIKKTTSSNEHYFDVFTVDNNSPEFFLRKFLDPNLRSVTPKIAANLEVCLRTRSIE